MEELYSLVVEVVKDTLKGINRTEPGRNEGPDRNGIALCNFASRSMVPGQKSNQKNGL